MNVTALETKIRTYAQAYYLGEPIASDQEFDRLCDELRQENPDSYILKAVGFGVQVYGSKIPLPLEIKQSLPKTKDISTYTTTHKLGKICIAPKLDGLSVLINVVDGNYKVMTRGDGVHGVDITQKAYLIRNVPELLRALIDAGHRNFCMRGEVFVRPSTFNKVFSEEYANPRNLASGIVNRKSISDVQYLEFMAFDITLAGEEIKVGEQAHYFFAEQNVVTYTVFNYAYYCTKRKNEDMSSSYKVMAEDNDLPLDGLVVDGVLAWKEENTTVEGTIDYIEWKVSRLGRLIPVAVLEAPVDLYSTKVSRASAFNFEYVKGHKLGKGSKVKITKANEIIPYIVEVVNEAPDYKDLDKCYKCQGEIKVEGVHLVCSTCYDPTTQALKGFMEAFLLPKGVQQAEYIIQSLNIKNPSELRKLMKSNDTLADLTAVIGPHKAKLMTEHMKNFKFIPSNLFLASLGLPGVGEEASKDMCKKLFDYCNYGLEFTDVKLNKPATESLSKYRAVVQGFYTEFMNYIVVPFLGEYKAKVCVTGKLSESRSKFSDKLLKAGVELTEKLEKGTILVTNDTASGSSKNKRANELNLEIITEEEARKRWLQN